MRKCHTLNSLRQTLRDLPIGLYETYDRILLNVPEVHQVHVQRALIWLAFSRGPMTLGQVAEAVLVGREQHSMDLGDQFRDVHDLLDLCSSFVCLVGTPPLGSCIQFFQTEFDIQHINSDADVFLRLAHSSVKGYILSDRANIATLSMHRLTPGMAQHSMAEVCLIYLNRFNEQSLIRDEEFRRHPFLVYAAYNWWFHYDELPAEEEHSVVDLLLTFIDTHHYGYAYRNWLGFLLGWSSMDHQTPAPIAVLSSLGAPRAIRAIVENAAEVHVTEDEIRESLNFASSQGCEAVVQALLDAGDRLNRAGVIDASLLSQALSEATRRGFTAMVELLIRRGATAEGLDYSFVLRIAARQDKLNFVKLLLDYSTTNCNKIELFYGALQAAILVGQRSITEYLMERSAEIDITAKEDLYFATLQTAFFQKDDSTVRFLIGRAFGSEARDIRKAMLKVLDTSWTPRTKLVLLQILNAGSDHPPLERNHERDHIPTDIVYWYKAVELEYSMKETLLEERKLLEEEELMEETMDLLHRSRCLSMVAFPTIEKGSDGMV